MADGCEMTHELLAASLAHRLATRLPSRGEGRSCVVSDLARSVLAMKGWKRRLEHVERYNIEHHREPDQETNDETYDFSRLWGPHDLFLPRVFLRCGFHFTGNPEQFTHAASRTRFL